MTDITDKTDMTDITEIVDANYIADAPRLESPLRSAHDEVREIIDSKLSGTLGKLYQNGKALASTGFDSYTDENNLTLNVYETEDDGLSVVVSGHGYIKIDYKDADPINAIFRGSGHHAPLCDYNGLVKQIEIEVRNGGHSTGFMFHVDAHLIREAQRLVVEAMGAAEQKGASLVRAAEDYFA